MNDIMLDDADTQTYESLLAKWRNADARLEQLRVAYRSQMEVLEKRLFHDSCCVYRVEEEMQRLRESDEHSNYREIEQECRDLKYEIEVLLRKALQEKEGIRWATINLELK